MTRIERIQQTDCYKSGEWFSASRCAQSVSIPVDDIRTVLSQNPEIFESKRVQGKAMVYRKIKPRETLELRTRRYEFENDYSPRWY